jgi:hypothetical protein
MRALCTHILSSPYAGLPPDHIAHGHPFPGSGCGCHAQERQSDYRPDCQMEKQRIEIDPPFSDIITITWEDVPRFP